MWRQQASGGLAELPTTGQSLSRAIDSQFVSSVEKELAQCDAHVFTRLSKRGGAEVAEEIAESKGGNGTANKRQ